MAQKKSSKLKAGAPIRVKAGVTLPENPEVVIAGWTGTVSEASGSGSALKYIVEWDDATEQAMPAGYREDCESQGLYFKMACLNAADVEACPPADS